MGEFHSIHTGPTDHVYPLVFEVIRDSWRDSEHVLAVGCGLDNLTEKPL